MSYTRWQWSLICAVGLATLTVGAPGEGRPVPDETLGEERSRIIDRSPNDFDVDGGARRGGNLFHSFQEFGVNEGGSVYFLNPDGVNNIFSRVTGANRSDILGRLGVRGAANLFLMNPNGILFGTNASLDVQGSFVGTTANAIGFGDVGFFSATNPEVPSPLLTIDPSAFLFNQIGNGTIVSQAGALTGAPGQSLLLLGGNVVLDSSGLFSPGGRVEVGGVGGTGVVQLTDSGNALQLGYPTEIPRANVALQNNSFILATAGGSIAVNAENLGLTNSNILSALQNGQDRRSGDIVIDARGSLTLDRSSISQVGIEGSLGDTGNLIINAGSVRLLNTSQIANNSQRNNGSIRLNIAGELVLDGSQINSVVLSGSTGNAGDIFINAQSVNLANQSNIVSLSTGQGAAGDVTLIAQDAITLSGGSGIQSSANPFLAGTTSRASSGNIDIQARLLFLEEGSRIFSDSFDAGRAGNIRINTREAIMLNNAFINANALGTAEGGGDIDLRTGQLSLANFSVIRADTQNNFVTGSLGQGDAGNITINAQRLLLTNAGIISTSSDASRGNAGDITIRANDIEVTGFLRAADAAELGIRDLDLTSDGLLLSTIISDVTNNEITDIDVQGGTITIEAERLRLTNGGSITTEVQQARGQAGSIIVRANDSIEISGRPRFNNPSGLFSRLQTDGIGRGGLIQVRTGQLNLSDDGEISAGTYSQGDAGRIFIEASEVDLRGLSTAITTQVGSEGRGNGGSIDIRTQRLQIQDNAEISTNTFGIGNAGNLTVRADEIELTDTPDPQNADSGLFTAVSRGATGNAGNLTIETDRLTISNGAGIASGVLGQGQAGNISVQAEERISLNGGGISSSVAAGATGNGGRLSITAPALFLQRNSNITTSMNGTGNAGNLTINTGVLTVEGSSNITTSTSGVGNAGDLTIRAEQINVQNSSINTAVATGGQGNAGNLTINTQRLQLRNNADITSLSGGIGNAGNLTIRAEQIDLRNLGTSITTQISPGSQGRGGNLDIRTQQLQVRDNAQISTGTLGIGDAGNLHVRARTIELVNTPDPTDNFTGLFTLVTEEGVGNAGNLTVDTDRLIIRNGASISSEVFGRGQGGNLRVRASDRIDIIGFVPTTANNYYVSGIFTTTSGQGDAGNISIRSNNGITLQRRGRISSASLAGGRGGAGDINLRTNTLTISEGSSVLASVGSARRDVEGVALAGGQGRGGDIQITATDAIRISGIDQNGLSSTISTSTGRGATGRAGTVTLTTDDFQVNNGGVVTARTLNNSPAGSITINANTLTATSGGQVITSTSGAGNAGRIQLNIADEIHITGIDTNFADRFDRVRLYINRIDRGDRINDFVSNQGSASGLFANTSPRSTGNGGSINLNTTNLSMTDRAIISARSRGAGVAGDINLNIDHALQADNSTIATTATNSSGGDINFTGGTALLRGDSDIRTNSGIDGGNIDIDTNSLVAFDDSDIIASAQQQGGDIIFNNTIAFFENYNPEASNTDPNTLQNNVSADLNATGAEPGTINLPDTSFIQNSLTELAENVIDIDNVIANSCIVRTENGGTFLITGTGGLPVRPGVAPLSPYPAGEVRTRLEEDSSWQPGDAIVEPQGVYQLPDGQWIMSRECQQR